MADSPERGSESDLLHDLTCQLREDFPNVDDAAVAEQVHESWGRSARVTPLTHRIAWTERWARQALRRH